MSQNLGHKQERSLKELFATVSYWQHLHHQSKKFLCFWVVHFNFYYFYMNYIQFINRDTQSIMGPARVVGRYFDSAPALTPKMHRVESKTAAALICWKRQSFKLTRVNA